MNTLHDHIVKSYDEEQRRLLGEILRMGEMAAAQLEAALDVVERRDDKAAERIIANDEAIDTLEQEVSHDVMRLALRGPMARDLREILAALRITAAIERIDFAFKLVELAITLDHVPRQRLVAADQRLHRIADRELREAAHLGDQPAQAGDVLVERLDRVLSHQPYLPVM
jgi:phosphate transport system protein